MPNVMTIDQLVVYLQTSKSTLYKLLQEGKLPGKKIGRQWRFHREIIDAWLAESSNQGRRPSPTKKTSRGGKK